MLLPQVRVVKRGFMNVGREPSSWSLTQSTSDKSEFVRMVNSLMLLNGVVFVCNLIRYCYKRMLLSVGQWGKFWPSKNRKWEWTVRAFEQQTFLAVDKVSKLFQPCGYEYGLLGNLAAKRTETQLTLEHESSHVLSEHQVFSRFQFNVP